MCIGHHKGLFLGNIVSCRNTWEDFFCSFLCTSKKPHTHTNARASPPHPRKQSRRVNNMESDCRDQESSSPRRDSSQWGRPPSPGLWYLSLCQACYHVNSVQRIVIFLFYLSLVVSLCFFFFSFTPRPLCLRLCPLVSRPMKSVALRQRGDLGIAVTFSSVCGFLPNCATEEIFIFQ